MSSAEAVDPDKEKSFDGENEEDEELDEEDEEDEEDLEDLEEEDFEEEEEEEEELSKVNDTGLAVKSDMNVNRKTLFIKNLPMATTEADIRALSSDILEVRIDISHLKNEKNPKYAILDFANGEVADRTLKSLKDKQVHGVDIVADFIGGKSARPHATPALSISSDLLKLYVTGFGKEITMAQLKDMFPTASDITLPLNPADGNRPVGYAFIHFADETVCKAAHDSMQDYVYQSRTLVVMYGKKNTPESRRALEELKRRFPMPKRGRPKKVRTESKRPVYDDDDDDDEDEDDDEDDDDDDDDEDD